MSVLPEKFQNFGNLQYMKDNGSKLDCILSDLCLYYCLVRRVNVIAALYFIEELYRFDSIFTQSFYISHLQNSYFALGVPVVHSNKSRDL